MGYTPGKILPEAKFFSICELVKPDKLSTFQIQWWDRHRVDNLISKEKNQKEERNHGNLKSRRASYVRFESLRIVVLGFMPSPADPSGGSPIPESMGSSQTY